MHLGPADRPAQRLPGSGQGRRASPRDGWGRRDGAQREGGGRNGPPPGGAARRAPGGASRATGAAGTTGVHADIDALKGTSRGADQVQAGAARRGRPQQMTRSRRPGPRWKPRRSTVARRLGRCSRASLRPAASAPQGGRPRRTTPRPTARGTRGRWTEATQRLEQVRHWQWRVDQEASEFRGTASRFRDLLENEMPRLEEHLAAIIASLEAARRVQAPAS